MFFSIGRRRAPQGLVGLLDECHLRVRTFLGAAERLAAAVDRIGDDAAATVARDIHRYFADAFPLHLADEDNSIAPRLRGERAEVDRALVTMSADHQAHGADVRELVEICGELKAGRAWSQRASARLAVVTAALAVALEVHLEFEERLLFPAIKTLGAPVSSRFCRRCVRVASTRSAEPDVRAMHARLTPIPTSSANGSAEPVNHVMKVAPIHAKPARSLGPVTRGLLEGLFDRGALELLDRVA
jgi:iron-sulfur cluster repair protein YtfE (RIC family)